MYNLFMMFVWNESKRKKVIKEHGVDFASIKDIFDDVFSLDFQDSEHSESEQRFGIIAKTAEYGLILAIYTATETEVRIITARRAEKWMVNEYEKQRKRY